MNFAARRFSFFITLCLVQFYRKAVGVAEEYEPLRRVFIHANGFMLDNGSIEFGNSLVNIGHGECQVPQSRSLGIRQACRRIGKREEFDTAYAVTYEVRLIGFPFGTVVLGNHTEAQEFSIETFRSSVIGTYDRHMVKGFEFHTCQLTDIRYKDMYYLRFSDFSPTESGASGGVRQNRAVQPSMS